MSLTVRLDPELERELEGYCHETRRTKTDVVTDLLRDFLADRLPRKTPYQLAEEVGLIGSFEGGPPDLAENAKHYAKQAIRAKHSR